MNELLTTVAAALIAGTVAWFTARMQKPKITAESESLAVDTLRDTVSVLRSEVNDLRKKVHVLEGEMERVSIENRELHKGNGILRGQIFELGGTPRWPA